MTQKEEKEFIKKFNELTPVNQNSLLSYAYGIHVAQENTKKDICRQYGLTPEGCPAERRAEGAV
jgi:hypothetical protein